MHCCVVCSLYKLQAVNLAVSALVRQSNLARAGWSGRGAQIGMVFDLLVRASRKASSACCIMRGVL